MAPKKRRTNRPQPSVSIVCHQSPAQKTARNIKKKYKGKRMTPNKMDRVRRALYSVSTNEMSLRKAAAEYGLSYSFLQRRYSGEVELNKIKGPDSVFTEEEEEHMALWLSEMAQRGLGYRVCEFLDFVQDIVKREKRKTPFKDGRPGSTWYTAFKNRNKHIIAARSETPLELKRSKLTKDLTDRWYARFRDFLVNVDCIEKPKRIWNADESGFNMGYNQSKVIGPANRDIATPQIAAGKQRLTVMFCGNASGDMMPPFFAYPAPKPRGYNPLTGSMEGSDIAYTKKGWMDTATFAKFIDHFDKFAGTERPVVLLLDSVSSHVNHAVFMAAKEKGIEIYRLVPNATHLMQPLDKGVFGPLKAKWHLTVRKYSRENPGRIISREIFAQKLHEAFMQFYKPLTVINAFKSSGIYPVDSSVITSQTLKPGLTFSSPQSVEKGVDKEKFADPVKAKDTNEQAKATGALQVFEETLSTPTREKYHTRLREGYDIEGTSPCFDVFKKLHHKAHSEMTIEQHTPLDMLADAAIKMKETSEEPSTSGKLMSPLLKEVLVYPKATENVKPVRQTMLSTLPDNLTSDETIRTLSLKELEKVKNFAQKEKKAKQLHLKEIKRSEKASSSNIRKKGKSKGNASKGKGLTKPQVKNTNKAKDCANKEYCKGCLVTWDEDLESGAEKTWLQCDVCDGWLHVECLSGAVDEDEPFCCPECDQI